VDLATGAGVAEAVNGAVAIIHCATDSREPLGVDLTGLDHLYAAAAAGTHLLYPGIVGCDLIPTPYYRAKTLCEERIAGGPLPWTILRATQFHQLIWRWYATPRRNPFLAVPASTRYQVMDPAELARLLVDAVESGPAGRLPDIGGPLAYEARELARSCLIASGSGRRVIAYNKPGIAGAALRAGANLTPNRGGGETWNEFMTRRMAAR
jgi:uncharacterized protein YbjT (DUF2867 family)